MEGVLNRDVADVATVLIGVGDKRDGKYSFVGLMQT